jgi:hypothetical protein
MFFGKTCFQYGSSFHIVPKMNLLDDTFPMGYHAPKTKIVCKSYDPEEVDVLTYPNGAHMTFGASSPRVRFLDV